MRYEAKATVVDGKWRVTVPDIDGHAETDTLIRIEFEARMMIAEQLEMDPDSFDVTVSYDSPPLRWMDPDGMEYAWGARVNPYTHAMTERYFPMMKDFPR